jgi:hypothetical protein
MGPGTVTLLSTWTLSMPKLKKYVISFCKAYLIDARSQRPEVDAIGEVEAKIIVDVSPAEIRQAMSRPPGHD